MHKRRHMPALHNAIIYNPFYIQYYLLQTIQEFKDKFNSVKPYPHMPSTLEPLTADELAWVRLEAEDALSDVFLRQRDESRQVLKERLTTMALLIIFETYVWHTHGLLLAVYSVLPTVGLLETANNIIAKHKNYKNELYAASVVTLEKVLAIVKSPDRYNSPDNYYKEIKAHIHEAERQVALKRSEIKDALSQPNPREPLSYIADNFMYLMCRILAMGQIFGIKIPASFEVAEWQSKINEIAPISDIHLWPTQSIVEVKDSQHELHEIISKLIEHNNNLVNELQSVKKRVKLLENRPQYNEIDLS